MNTITQGYSADVARGLAHPDSVEARRARIASAKVANVNRQTDINRACITIRNLCRTERDVIDVLHALAGGLNAAIFKSSDIVEIVEQLDVMADAIEFQGGSMSHTPGPWHVGKRDPEWLPIRDANDLWVCDCGFRNEVSENEANANLIDLIAASPDLLEACKAMVAWDEAENNARPYVEDGGIAFRNRLNLCAEAFDKARAAIKKAEGQS